MPRASCAREQSLAAETPSSLVLSPGSNGQVSMGSRSASGNVLPPAPCQEPPSQLSSAQAFPPTPDRACGEAKSRRTGPLPRGSGQRRERDVSGSRPPFRVCPGPAPSFPWLAHRGSKHVGATVSLAPQAHSTPGPTDLQAASVTGSETYSPAHAAWGPPWHHYPLNITSESRPHAHAQAASGGPNPRGRSTLRGGAAAGITRMGLNPRLPAPVNDAATPPGGIAQAGWRRCFRRR